MSLSDYFEDLTASPVEIKELPWQSLGAVNATQEISGEMHPTVVIEGNLQLGKGSLIGPYVVVEGDVRIGMNCTIRPFTLLRSGTIIGDNVVVGNGSEVKNSIIFDNAKIASHAFVGDSILGKGARIGSGTIISNRRFDQKEITTLWESKIINTKLDKYGGIIGDYVRVGANSVSSPGFSIEKHTWVYAGTLIRGHVKKDSIIKLRQAREVTYKERLELKSTDCKGNV